MSDNLNFVTKMSTGSVDGYVVGHRWPTLFFEPSGAARLANIAGWLTGLSMGGQTQHAEKLANDICAKLDYLNGFGGNIGPETVVDGLPDYLRQIPEWRAAWLEVMELRPAKLPAYRVVLSDDGTFGGFRLAWYAGMTTTQVWAKEAEEDAGDFDNILRRLRVRKDLEQYIMRRRPELVRSGMGGEDTYGYVFVHYGYAFNGGLLLHGMGQETFAVDISDDSGPHWSVHT